MIHRGKLSFFVSALILISILTLSSVPAATVSHTASQITGGGILGSGDYVFPGSVNVTTNMYVGGNLVNQWLYNMTQPFTNWLSTFIYNYNQTTPANSYADTKALPGTCPAGQVVQNTTTTGVQCAVVTAGTYNATYDAKNTSQWIASGNDISNRNSGNVGIGTTTPQQKLNVVGDANVTGTIYAHNYSANSPITFVNSTGSVMMTIGENGNISASKISVSGNTAPTSIGSVATDDISNSIYVQGKYAYTGGGPGWSQTMKIYDVSNPAAPSLAGSLTVGNYVNSIYVQGKYAYALIAGNLQIFDVSNPAAPNSIGSAATYGSPGSDRSLYVQGKYAYVAGYDMPTVMMLQIFDVSNPAKPSLIGNKSISNPHRAIDVQGRYLYGIGVNGLEIFDVINASAPVSVGSLYLSGYGYSINVRGGYAYAGGGSILNIVNVTNPATPTLLGNVTTSGTIASIYVQGKYAYAANGNSKIQIFDVSNASAPSLVTSSSTGAEPKSIYVRGGYAYLSTSSTIEVFDIGTYIQQLETGGIATDTLSTTNNAQIGNNIDVRGSAAVGGDLNVDGNLAVGGYEPGMYLLKTITVSNQATVDFTNIPAGFSSYKVVLSKVKPVTNAVFLTLRVSSDNGASWNSTAGLYGNALFRWTNAGTAVEGNAVGGAATGITITSTADPMSNTEGIGTEIEVSHLINSTQRTKFVWETIHWGTGSNNYIRISGGGVYDSLVSVNGLRFFFSSGNISTGTLKLYGMK